MFCPLHWDTLLSTVLVLGHWLKGSPWVHLLFCGALDKTRTVFAVKCSWALSSLFDSPTGSTTRQMQQVIEIWGSLLSVASLELTSRACNLEYICIPVSYLTGTEWRRPMTNSVLSFRRRSQDFLPLPSLLWSKYYHSFKNQVYFIHS